MKILVIEDEKLLANSIRALLEGKGFDVEVAYDGEAVSYTHLTLPTNREVEISVDAVTHKKKKIEKKE